MLCSESSVKRKEKIDNDFESKEKQNRYIQKTKKEMSYPSAMSVDPVVSVQSQAAEEIIQERRNEDYLEQIRQFDSTQKWAFSDFGIYAGAGLIKHFFGEGLQLGFGTFDLKKTLDSKINVFANEEAVLIDYGNVKQWGNLKVASFLGQGGYGAVYEVRFERPPSNLRNKRFALKVQPHIMHDRNGDKQTRNMVRFAQELDKYDTMKRKANDKGKTMGECGIIEVFYGAIHQIIVTNSDGSTRSVFVNYILMESMDTNLKQFIETTYGEKEYHDCLPLVIERLFAALELMHDTGIVHRDLKAENVVVKGTFQMGTRKITDAAIIDFGLAVYEEEVVDKLTEKQQVVIKSDDVKKRLADPQTYPFYSVTARKMLIGTKMVKGVLYYPGNTFATCPEIFVTGVWLDMINNYYLSFDRKTALKAMDRAFMEYMISGKTMYGSNANIFTVGLILFHILTGIRPFATSRLKGKSLGYIPKELEDVEHDYELFRMIEFINVMAEYGPTDIQSLNQDDIVEKVTAESPTVIRSVIHTLFSQDYADKLFETSPQYGLKGTLELILILVLLVLPNPRTELEAFFLDIEVDKEIVEKQVAKRAHFGVTNKVFGLYNVAGVGQKIIEFFKEPQWETHFQTMKSIKSHYSLQASTAITDLLDVDFNNGQNRIRFSEQHFGKQNAHLFLHEYGSDHFKLCYTVSNLPVPAFHCEHKMKRLKFLDHVTRNRQQIQQAQCDICYKCNQRLCV